MKAAERRKRQNALELKASRSSDKFYRETLSHTRIKVESMAKPLPT